MIGSRYVGRSSDMIGFLWDSSLAGANKSILYGTFDVALQRLGDYSLIMAMMRDLLQGNSLGLFISISAQNKEQLEKGIDFNFALLVLYTHLIGVNAIASRYRERIAADAYLTQFFEEIIGDKYTNAVKYYDANGSSTVDRIYDTITDSNYSNLLTNLVSIFKAIGQNLAGITMYAGVATLVASVTSSYHKNEWYSRLSVSPEMVLGYSTWKSVIDFSVFTSVIGEGMVKRFTDANMDAEFWKLLNPMIDIYWTFLYSNILITMEYNKINNQGNAHELAALGGEQIQTASGDYVPTEQGDTKFPGMDSMKVNGKGFITPTGGKNYGAFALNGNNVSLVSEDGTIDLSGSISDWMGTLVGDRYSLLSDIPDDPYGAAPGETETKNMWMRYTRADFRTAGGSDVTCSSGSESTGLGGCDIDFKVEAGDETDADSCVITLWNLTQATKDAIVCRVVDDSNNVITVGTEVSLTAGYIKANGKIFEGYVWDRYDMKVGADVATIITGYDKIKNFQTPATLPLSFPNGTQYTDVITAVIQASNVAIGYIEDPGCQVGPAEGDTTQTISFFGTATSIIDEVLSQVNGTLANKKIISSVTSPDAFTFFVRDAKAYFVQRKYVITDEIQMSADNGLLEATKIQSSTTDSTVQIKCLLTHHIKTAAKIILKSEAVNGTFGVRSYTHTSQGSTYYTEAKLGDI